MERKQSMNLPRGMHVIPEVDPARFIERWYDPGNSGSTKIAECRGIDIKEAMAKLNNFSTFAQWCDNAKKSIDDLRSLGIDCYEGDFGKLFCSVTKEVSPTRSEGISFQKIEEASKGIPKYPPANSWLASEPLGVTAEFFVLETSTDDSIITVKKANESDDIIVAELSCYLIELPALLGFAKGVMRACDIM